MNEPTRPLPPVRPHFKRYPAYKHSGVEWLGDIPAHWEVATLKRRARRIQTGSTPPTGEARYYEEGTVAWYGPGSFSDDLPLQAPIRHISDSAVRDGVARVFEAGSSVIVTIGATIGKVAYMERPGSCNQQITGVSFDIAQVFPRYGTYQLKRLEPVLRGVAPNTTLPILDQEEIGYLPFVVPSYPEQDAIAAFLDRETARIDALAAKKERLIELLQEKRTALITQAVTKGLPSPSSGQAISNVPMKDSGVGWLGEIPAHWGTTFLDKLVDPLRRITYGIVQPGEPDPDGILMVRGQNYSRGWSRPEDIFRVSRDIEAPYKRARLKQGDIVMTIVGAGTGNVAIVPDWLEGGNLTQTTARIALDPRKATNRYFAYQLQSVVGIVSVELTVKGAAQPGLNLGHISKYHVVVPPLSEQKTIADFLDLETSRFDVLIDRVGDAVERLKELRTALISAAVTGKIDVRGEVAGGASR